jgi:RNA 2',3'-cyclic 3'-phosphodiesterase
MRLFTGLDLPAEVVGNLERLLQRLRPAASIQWSAPSNLHITTKFIGEWPEQRVAELTKVLGEIPSRYAIPVQIHELGFFPNARAPRIFWCGIEASRLADLAAETDRAAARLGIAAETRPFTPHLTLARIKERFNPEPLRRAIEALPSVEFGAFEAASFFLYRSQLHPTGSVYTKLAEFPFAK